MIPEIKFFKIENENSLFRILQAKDSIAYRYVVNKNQDIQDSKPENHFDVILEGQEIIIPSISNLYFPHAMNTIQNLIGRVEDEEKHRRRFDVNVFYDDEFFYAIIFDKSKVSVLDCGSSGKSSKKSTCTNKEKESDSSTAPPCPVCDKTESVAKSNDDFQYNCRSCGTRWVESSERLKFKKDTKSEDSANRSKICCPMCKSDENLAITATTKNGHNKCECKRCNIQVSALVLR